MKKYKIALLPGDGVGKEVIMCAKMVLDALDVPAEYVYEDIGWEFWKSEGNPLPERTVEDLKTCDCALLGAITSKPEAEANKELSEKLQGKGYHYRSPIIELRQKFDLGINLRPCHSTPGNPLVYKDNIHITIFRENTEGSYCGIEYASVPKELYDVVVKANPAIKEYEEKGLDKTSISFRVMCEEKSERIIRAAFDYAKEKGKKKVTIVDKPNILRATGGMFVNLARKVAKEYPEITLEEVNIDAACMWLVKNPESFEVIVAENLFGDIISDLCAQLIGGMGFAFSGNIGNQFAVFEPIHGSAPKYAGLHKVNPIATIFATSYMLEWLGEFKKSNIIRTAVNSIVKGGIYGTYDMGLTDTNIEFTEEIITEMRKVM